MAGGSYLEIPRSCGHVVRLLALAAEVRCRGCLLRLVLLAAEPEERGGLVRLVSIPDRREALDSPHRLLFSYHLCPEMAGQVAGSCVDIV